MKKFYAVYKAPVSVLEAWMKTPEAERKTQEANLKAEWDTWMKAHGSMVKETAGLGKTKQVTNNGIADSRNDLMMYSIVEADSAEKAAEIFKGHPHLKIPEASIEIMEANVLPGMQ